MTAHRAHEFVAERQLLKLALRSQSTFGMPAFAHADQTIRIAKRPTGPTRTLRQQFAPARPRRWPYLLIPVLAVIALATPIKMPQHAARSAQAHKLLELIRH